MSFYTLINKRIIKKQKKKIVDKTLVIIDLMIKAKKELIVNVFKNTNESKVYLPVSFNNIIDNIAGQLKLNKHSIVDISPLDAYKMIEKPKVLLHKTELFI